MFVWIDECAFIDDFTSQYEDLDSISPAYDQSGQCEMELTSRFAQHPEVELRRLERMYDDAEILKQGRAVVQRLDGQSWTAVQTSRLYALLANKAEHARNKSSIEWARLALRFDDRADVRVPLARQLLATGKKSEAVETLTGFVDDHNPKDTLYLVAKMRVMADAGLRAEALATYDTLRESSYYDHNAVAKLLARMDDVEHARAELEKAMTPRDAPRNRRELFLIDLEHGLPAQAQQAYMEWRDLGWQEDPLGLSRFALFVRAPQLPWAWRDLLGLFGFCAALGVGALAAAVPISLVHYRGLARRSRKAEPYPTQGWRLTDAWAALFAFVVAEVVAYYAVGPVRFTEGGPILSAGEPALHWSNLVIAHSFLVLALLWPIARASALHQPNWWGGNWSLGKGALIGAGIATALRVPLLLVFWLAPDSLSRAMLDMDVLRLVGETNHDFGLVAAFWALAIAAPVVEEIAFRGVLLGAFRQHLSPWWANAAQAALFAALHGDLRASIPLFVIGLILGSLARRSGGLFAPMVMHAVFNGLAGLALLRT